MTIGRRDWMKQVAGGGAAAADVRVYRGSTWMTIAPRSFARSIQRIAIEWFSATFEPSTRKTFACWRSAQWFVIAPRPNEAPRLGTVGLCQSRAWCSTYDVPKRRPILLKR